VRRTVDPLGIVLKGSIWYLVAAFDGWDVVFRVSRMRTATLLEETATVPAGFDLSAFWESWVRELTDQRDPGEIRVRLRVDERDASELPRRLGEATRHQIVEAAGEKTGALELEVVFDSVDDAKASLLGLGTTVEVLAPLDLRAQLAQTAAGVARLYAGSTQGSWAFTGGSS
jgi:predicted DNA-binding transcriptional regulator YafY